MRNRILIILFVLSFIFASCKKKNDSIEIYLTKEKIESYDGVPLRTAIKDTTIIRQVLESYNEEIRIDTLNNKPIYMGHFVAELSDLEEKPFINDSEILGFDFENSEIHFSKSVTEKIYKSIPEWRKKSHFGKQFVLCHNGKIILNGYFIGSMSKYHSNTYQIKYHRYPEHKRNDALTSVAFSISDSLNFEKNNLKKNKELYHAFKNRLINQSE
ncbi:hypothetical protein [Flavobacterium lacus]|uniref:Lipoprotein n=1 Tax=Flavobacterium lacus TaxID=1353778 RepID=A0A328WQE2_9FLAO|nr:hypothetical protein [Flavobacterium lacus]RAR47346.1 hypothetical protein B0I10_10919 [Flavobacterium lacus]